MSQLLWSWVHRCFLGTTVVRWKNWKSGGQRNRGGRRLGVGRDVGLRESWAKTLSLRNQSPGCCLEFQNGERFQLLSYGNWPGSRRWVELKPRPSSVNLTHRSINHWNLGEEKAGKGGQRVKEAPFHLDLVMEVAVGGIKHWKQLEGKIPSIWRMSSAGL